MASALRHLPALNAMTVDVEDWYHVCGARTSIADPASRESRIHVGLVRILDLFQTHDVRATFFVLGSIADDAPELIRDISHRGHEIASHGYSHQPLDEQTPSEFEDDLRHSLAALGPLSARPVVGFRAPQWSLRRKTWWALEAMARAGIRYDASTVPLTGMGDRTLPPWPYSVETPSGRILELPLTTMRCFWERLPVSGGLPLRVTPYWFVVEVLKAANRRGHPHVVYFHPWEFDVEQPRVQMRLGKRFAHYFRLSVAARRANWLLGRFRYAPAGEILGVW